MDKIYGNLIIALEKTKTSRKELGYCLNIAPNTLTSRFNDYGYWTLREINIIKELLESKGYDKSIEELFKYE